MECLESADDQVIVLTLVFSSLFVKSIENFPGLSFHRPDSCMIFYEGEHDRNAPKSVTVNAPLMKKVYMPKYIFTVSKVTSCMVDMVLSMGALIIVMIFTRAPFYPEFSVRPIVIAGVSVLRAWIFPCADACVFP